MRAPHMRMAALKTAVLALGAVSLLAQDPSPVPEETALMRADLLWVRGQFDEADDLYASELARDGSPRARFGVARSLAMRSRLDEALREVTIAREAAPTDGSIAALRGDIYQRLFRYQEAAEEYETALRYGRSEMRMIRDAIRARITLLKSLNRDRQTAIEPDPNGVYSVPFELRQRKVVIPARVNGTSLNFVIDTGSERSAVSEDVASRARMRIVGETFAAGVGSPGVFSLGVTAADRIEIGGLRLRNIPLSVRRVNPRVGLPSWQYEIFSPSALGLSTKIDYQKRVVTFSRLLPEEPAAVRLPLRFYHLPMVRGILNDHLAAYFIVDTGGELISINSDTVPDLKMAPPSRRVPLRVFGMTGRDQGAFLLPGVDLAFQSIEYRNLGMAVLDLRTPSALLGFRVGGIVGHRFLAGHRVAMDLARSELRMDPITN